MYPRSMEDSDCVVVMGSNMAENHPVAFRWPMKAKVEHGAKLIHVDPRFTRTSAVADIYAPVRAGSDIAFLGGAINYVLNSERWNTDPFFRSWVLHYTNAATIVSPEYLDAEDNDGVFSGLMDYKGGVAEWPYNGFAGQYDDKTWQYSGTRVGDQGRSGATALSGETPGTPSGTQQAAPPAGPPYDRLVRSLLKPPPPRDETLQDPRCVFQIVKRHFSRYTPEMVERTTGCPRDLFLKVAETVLANSGADRTTSFGRSTPTGRRSLAAARCCSCCSATSDGPAPASWRCAATPRSRARPTCRRSTTRFTATCRIRLLSRSTRRSPTISRPRRCPPATGRTCRSSWCRT
jgi:formate dehydrogenase major subunit